MKKIVLVILVALLAVSCSKNENGSNSSLEGTVWKTTLTEETESGEKVTSYYTYEFYETTFTLTTEGECYRFGEIVECSSVDKGVYTYSHPTIMITAEDENFIDTGIINGDIMTTLGNIVWKKQ